MLERIREGSQSMIVKVLLVFIIITFALTGVSGYLGSSSEPSVATVNGEDITQSAFERAYQNERSRMQEQMGDMFDQLSANTGYMSQFRAGVIEQLVEQKLIEQYAKDNGLRVSDEQVKAAIREVSAFRSAGQFSNDVYLMSLRNAGFTPESFAEVMRADMMRNQVLRTLLGSDFSVPSEAEYLESLFSQQRSGRYLTVALADYLDDIEVTEAEIQAYYDQNRGQFATEARVKVEYVALDYDAIVEDIDLSEADVRAYYDNNIDRFTTEEERRVAHILIETGDDEAAAREEIEQIKQQLDEGADFATLAREFSDDVFSGEQGGDLDWISRDQMDPEFEEAAFALEEVGAVTDIVSTSFGFHLIQLTDMRSGEVEAFADVKDDIERRLQEQQAEEAFFMAQQRLAEVSFEIPDSLQPAADELDARLVTTDWFTESSAPTTLAAPQVLSQVFSNDLIDERLNSDLIEVDDQTAMVVRVLEHEPAGTQPLADVSDMIAEQLRTEKAQDQALATAEAYVTQIRAGEFDQAERMESLTEITRQSQNVARGVREALFKLSPVAAGSDAVSVATTRLNSGDVAVVELTDVTVSEGNTEDQQQIQEQLEQRHSEAAYRAFVAALRADAEVELKRTSVED